MRLSRLIWIAVSLTAIQTCSTNTTVDRVPNVKFDGGVYDVGYATDLGIESSDLTAIGALSESYPLASEPSVFALAGVDPEDVIVMRADPGESTAYLVGYARGSLPDSMPNETDQEASRRLLEAIPELCRYHLKPPLGTCEAGFDGAHQGGAGDPCALRGRLGRTGLKNQAAGRNFGRPNDYA